MVLDIILGAVLVIAFLTGVRQGLVKSIWRLAAWIITGIAVYIALEPVVEFMSTTPLYEKIYTSAYDIFSKEASTAAFSGLPEWLGKSKELTAVVNENTAFIAENVATAIADIIIKAISAVGLFVVIRLVLWPASWRSIFADKHNDMRVFDTCTCFIFCKSVGIRIYK